MSPATPVEMLLGAASVAFGLAAAFSYLMGVLKGVVRPHLFSWLIWAIAGAVVSVAQITQNGGAGAWPTITGTLICTTFTLLSLHYGTKDITRSDKIALVCALCAIPLWPLTKDPTASVILLTFIDAIGYFPMLRKSWNAPYEEGVVLYAGSVVSGACSLFALAHFSLATAFYPVVILALNTAITGILLYRRRVVEEAV